MHGNARRVVGDQRTVGVDFIVDPVLGKVPGRGSGRTQSTPPDKVSIEKKRAFDRSGHVSQT